MSAYRGSRLVSLLSFAGALAALVGCGQQAGSTSAVESTGASEQAVTTETNPAEAAPTAPAAPTDETGRPRPGRGFGPHGHRQGPPGPDFLLMAALHELELTPDQKATIQAELDKNKPGAKAPSPPAGAPIAALAQGVRAGKIDKASLLAKLGTFEKGDATRTAALAKSLETLHTTLTKEQRSALVEAISKRAEGRGPGGEFEGKGGRRPPEPGAMPGGAHVPGPLGFMLDGVELTQTQREAINKALEANRPSPPDRAKFEKLHESMRAQMHERLASFAGDSFDAKAFVTPPEGAKAGGPPNPFEHMVNDLAVVTPLLEPAQREALAARLEKGPPGFHGRPGQRGQHDAQLKKAWLVGCDRIGRGPADKKADCRRARYNAGT